MLIVQSQYESTHQHICIRLHFKYFSVLFFRLTVTMLDFCQKHMDLWVLPSARRPQVVPNGEPSLRLGARTDW